MSDWDNSDNSERRGRFKKKKSALAFKPLSQKATQKMTMTPKSSAPVMNTRSNKVSIFRTKKSNEYQTLTTAYF